MDNIKRGIVKHYHREDLYQSILDALQNRGVDLDKVQRSDIEAGG